MHLEIFHQGKLLILLIYQKRWANLIFFPLPFWLNYICNMYALQVGYGGDWGQKGTQGPSAVNARY